LSDGQKKEIYQDVQFFHGALQLFSGLHSSNSFMKLIAKVADGHFDAITQVNKRCANCGHRSAEFFYFVRQY